MLQALPMIAATLAMAGSSQALPTSAVARLHSTPSTCRAGVLDQQFVIKVPKTPAYGNKGLLRLIGGQAGGRVDGSPGQSCILRTYDAP